MGDEKLQQNIYGHGGSRIYLCEFGARILLCDTYYNEAYALAVMQFTKEWLAANPPQE